ncbi:hypothetical protein LCGC14_0835490 [marine sediment metagenome]
MKLNSANFALAASLTTAIVWVACSFLVVMLPQATMIASGDMIHMDIQNMMWSLTLSGFIKGLILWSLSVGLSAWIFAVIYNRFQS